MDLDLVTMAGRLRQRGISAVGVTEACLARIGRFDPTLNVFRHVIADDACDQARSSDQRSGLLAGVPVAVKDNIDIAGLVTRSGLGPRHEEPAAQDAEIVGRLRAAGAVILGHLNMHEGALGATTDNPHYGRTHNPWRVGFTPGGSSGGSAAAVAARLCPVTLGTDTMGSVRLPAAYCGVVGYKPSHGLLSNDGIEPLCAKLDQVGPMARSVADILLLMEALSRRSASPMTTELNGLRFGRLAEFDKVLLSDDVRRAFENSLYRLHQADVDMRDVSIEGLQPDKLRRAGLLLAEAEAAEHFAEDRARFPGAFSADFTAMLDYGAKAGAAKLAEAERLVDQTGSAFNALFDNIDLLIAPTAPQTAFSFDEDAPANQADLTALASIAGAPAISLPIPSADLPVGLQLIGRRGADVLVLRAAELLESDLSFKGRDLMLEEIT